MDIKVNQITGAGQVYDPSKAPQNSEEFKFMLMSKIAEEDLQARLTSLMEEITMQGDRISKKKALLSSLLDSWSLLWCSKGI